MIWFYFVLSYLIGTIMFGYIIIKFLYRKDIRLQGSGNVGARNAGRIFGKKAFVIIFLGDALKGSMVVLVAQYLQFSDSIQLLGLGIAILGHLWPITLNFKGGKGISAFIGGIIAFEPLSVPVILLSFLVLYPFVRSFTVAGLGAFVFIPILLLFRDYDGLSCFILIGILLVIILVHSENLFERLSYFGRKK
ncbi:glycerol-3-phosphate acyltransferase [Bacillus sp. CGMCC 1.16607]|uniref:glycerol-3-phosphate acyltransferase n=1 Tax=Bacillus sp. CGMCC 1.16607 TaxID=3351842 RepID=UPI003631B482